MSETITSIDKVYLPSEGYAYEVSFGSGMTIRIRNNGEQTMVGIRSQVQSAQIWRWSSMERFKIRQPSQHELISVIAELTVQT